MAIANLTKFSAQPIQTAIDEVIERFVRALVSDEPGYLRRTQSSQSVSERRFPEQWTVPDVTKQNVPDSFESWDARRTTPPPKACSFTS